MRAALREPCDPLEALKRIGVAYVVFAYQNCVEFKLMFRPEPCGANDDSAAKQPVEAYELLCQTIADCQAAGMLAANSSETAVLAAWSMVHGLASLMIDGPTRDLAPTLDAARKTAQECIDALVAGLART